jgi:O-antigen ligase
MDRKIFHRQAHYYLALLIAMCLPLARLTPVFIALLLLNWLVEGDFRNKFQEIFKNKLALLFIAFFVMHLIGLSYTENMPSGLFDVQVKFSLLVFPVVLASRPFTNAHVKNIFYAFIVGGILCALLMLSRAVYTYFVFSENNFFYQAFSFLIHPSYLSMYFNVVIAWLLLHLLTNSKTENRLSKLLSVIIVLFFSIIIVLLSSKLGLLTMIFLYTGFLIYFIVSRRKFIIGFVGLAFIIGSVYSLVRFVPEVGARVDNAIAAMTTTSTNQAESESTAVRMLIWSAANQVIGAHFLFGTGTGDAKDVLVKEYEKRGMTGALEHKLNTHNEFYQVFVSLGLIGFILLLMQLFFPLVSAFKTQNVIYILFLLIIIINFIPESMLETQAGVMFFAFFNSMLCFCNNNHSNSKDHSIYK